MSVGRMSRTAGLVLLVSFLMCAPLVSIPDPCVLAGDTTSDPLDEQGDEPKGSADSSWPKFRHDLNNTGASSSIATNIGVPLWIRDLWAPIQATPTIVDGVVYVGNMKWRETEFFAINAYDGEIIWSFPLDDYVVSSAAVADGVVFFGDRSLPDNFHALNITTGSEVWSYTASNGMHSSPAVSDGMVFFGSMTAFEKESIYALDEFSGAEIWTLVVGNGSATESSPVVYDGIVYIGTAEGKGRLLALDEYGSGGTTDIIWSYQCPLPISWVETSPVLADGLLFFGSRNTHFYAVDMDGMFDGDQGVPDDTPFNNSDLIWVYEFDWAVTASAAYANGVVYIPNNDVMYALNTSEDQMEPEERVLWTFQAGDYIGTSPAIADGKIFFGSADKHLYALSLESGELIWDYEAEGRVYSPAVGEGLVVVGSSDGKLYAFNVTGKPDLTVFDQDLQFAPTSTVLQGTEVTIDARIRNHGDAASDSGLVTFHKGNPSFGYPLETQSVGHLEPLESEPVQTIWTPLVSGLIEICVEIDSAVPDEARTDNNLACSFLDVVPAPDLALSVLDIDFIPSSIVTIGTDITIYVTVHNIGDETSDSSLVTVYDGDPNDGALTIGSVVLQNLKPGSERTVWIPWQSPTTGVHSVFVFVTDSLPLEVNLSNNMASRDLTVASKPDLTITSSDIEFAPSDTVTNGTQVLITVTIHNLGETECDSAKVEFFNGDPSTGGILMAFRYISQVPAHSGQTVSAYWKPPGTGVFQIHVRASDASPQESTESNNAAYRSLEVLPQSELSLPDLSISWSDISFSTMEPLEGEQVSISVLVHNIGQGNASHVVVRVFDGSAQIGNDQEINHLPGDGGSHVIEVSWAPAAGTHMITAQVDPDDDVLESDEANNIAQSILSTKERTESGNWWSWIVVILAAILALLVFLTLVVLLKRRRKEEDPDS